MIKKNNPFMKEVIGGMISSSSFVSYAQIVLNKSKPYHVLSILFFF